LFLLVYSHHHCIGSLFGTLPEMLTLEKIYLIWIKREFNRSKMKGGFLDNIERIKLHWLVRHIRELGIDQSRLVK